MRWKSYLSAMFGIVVLRFLDLYITYRYTPDLACEWNPLVSLFGASWSGLIFTQVLLITFIGTLMFFYFNRKPATVAQDGLSFDDFIYAYFYGKPRPWPIRMLSLPTNPERHLVFNGFVFMLMTILISGFAIIHNLLLIAQIDLYVEFVANYHNVYFFICFAAFVIFALYCFFTMEYAHYKRAEVEPT